MKWHHWYILARADFLEEESGTSNGSEAKSAGGDKGGESGTIVVASTSAGGGTSAASGRAGGPAGAACRSGGSTGSGRSGGRCSRCSGGGSRGRVAGGIADSGSRRGITARRFLANAVKVGGVENAEWAGLASFTIVVNNPQEEVGADGNVGSPSEGARFNLAKVNGSRSSRLTSRVSSQEVRRCSSGESELNRSAGNDILGSLNPDLAKGSGSSSSENGEESEAGDHC